MRPPNRPRTMTGINCTAATTPEQERVAGELEDRASPGRRSASTCRRARRAGRRRTGGSCDAGRRARPGSDMPAVAGSRRASGAWWAAWRLVAGCSWMARGPRRGPRGGRRGARGVPRPRRSSPRAARSSAAATPTWRSMRASASCEDRAPFGRVAGSSGTGADCGRGRPRPRAAGRSRRGEKPASSRRPRMNRRRSRSSASYRR